MSQRAACAVRQEDGTIVIRPRMFDLPDLSGTAVTPMGIVGFDYRRTADGARQYDIRLPDGAKGLLITPSGKRMPFTGSLRFAE